MPELGLENEIGNNLVLKVMPIQHTHTHKKNPPIDSAKR